MTKKEEKRLFMTISPVTRQVMLIGGTFYHLLKQTIV